ncbi:MAG TPA: PAS domain-containing protein [Deltaproteobacteria bacterium]|nr:PAS domain-containing protein [Deltaproteobacteria bacterium]
MPPGEDTPLCLRCFKDVTSRVLLEKELRGQANKIARIVEERTKKLEETKEYLERILEATHDLFFTLNLNKEITYLNRNVCQLGYEPEELLGKKVNVLISDSSFGNFFESVIKKKDPSSLHVDFLTKEGEIRPHVLDAYPLFNEEHRVVLPRKKHWKNNFLKMQSFLSLARLPRDLHMK